MNKQPELIDADKLLEWINFEIAKKFPDDVRQYEDGRRSVMTLLKRRIEQGVFSPDPIPLPTIKPEDWVYHTKFKAKGQVKRISESGKRAYVIWINGAAPSFVDLKSLEVVSHD